MSLSPITSHSSSRSPDQISWSELTPLPPSPGQAMQAGVAGPFVGVHNNALLVAGGANFPGQPPWAGGIKSWWNDVLVLPLKPGGAHEWITNPRHRLPRAMGYGVTFNTPDGVVCVGGADNDRCYSDVFVLAWNPRTRAVETSFLPPLPKPLGFMGGAMIGTTIYVAGGQSTIKDPDFRPVFWALDLSKRGSEHFGWKELPVWPGPGRMLPVVAAQSNGQGECIYLFSGRRPQVGVAAELLTDGYCYDPGTGRWTALTNVNGRGRDGRDGVCVMGATVVTRGDREILVIGGDRGELFKELEAHDLRVLALKKETAAPGADEAGLQRRIDAELAAKIKIYENHPGFSSDVLAYDTRTDTWRVTARMPATSQVTTQATKWGDDWLIPSGEVRPGTRTTRILKLRTGTASQ